MLYVPVHNQTFFVATTMSGFAGSTLSLARQLVTPRRASSWMLFAGVCGSTAPVATVLCEAPKENLLPKDKNGNVEWSRIPSHLTDSAFWDTLAKSTGSSIQDAIDSGVPTQLSYGFVSGYCSGMALKKVGRAAAVVLGLGFVTLQTLSYQGYIQVDHVKMKKQVLDFFDFNEDGKIDGKDRSVATRKVMEVLQFNLPAGGGFGAGFIGGLRSG